MNAEGIFAKLGYQKKVYESGIQYTKKDDETEMERVGRIKTDYIEFYPSSKEILITREYENREGDISRSDSAVLSFEAFCAVQKQVEELNW